MKVTTGHAASASAQTLEFLERPLRMLVGSDWVEESEGFPVIDPSDGAEIGMAPSAGEGAVNAAVESAKSAHRQGLWRGLTPSEQGQRLFALSDLVQRNQRQLAELEAIDLGKPVEIAFQEIGVSIEILRYYAGWPTKIYGTVNPVGSDVLAYTSREPIGVCVAITPWNGPLGMATKVMGPALACGNTIILKPAEQTVLSTLRLAELCLEAGFPPGVVQVVTGYGETVGQALVEHPDVDKVAFTGSTETGRHIARTAAATLKKVSLELGGKGPQIVFDDADIDALVARSFSIGGVWYNSGQICAMGSRWIVHESVYTEFCAAAVAASGALPVGPALDPGSALGPLVSSEQHARVLDYLAIGKSEGASVLLGGEGVPRDGYFVPPTIFADVEPGMRIAQEEIFGPVVAVIPFRDEEQALEIANGTKYGLSGAVWTRDISRGHRVARALECGAVAINSYGEYDWSTPFGGYKQSGYGRENGYGSIDMFTQLKSTFVRLAN